MKVSSPTARMVDWLTRTELRLGIFGVVAVAAVYVGFIAVPVAAAENLIRSWGYYIIASTFVWWLAALWRNRAPGWLLWRELTRAGWVCVGLISLFTVLAAAHEDRGGKILFDEFAIQSTAFNMHYFREVATMVRGYDLLGVFASTDNYLDKRPYFFAFLVSLTHDLTGYRSANAWWLNLALYPVTLGLVAWVGRLLAGWRGACLAVALLGSLPVFGMNATGTGMELLNIAMILLVVITGARYLESPDEKRQSALVLSVILLAQTRYESALYVGLVALVVLHGWWRARRVVLSWAGIAAPALLVPLALHNKVLSNSPEMWELKGNQTSRFSAEYLPDNLAGAVRFFFNRDLAQGNSVLLVMLGAVGLVWLVMLAVRRRGRLTGFAPVRFSLGWIGAGMAANTVLVSFYYWASFDDPMASRFSLPLHLLLVFAAVQLAMACDRRFACSAILTVVAMVFTLGFSIPKEAHHLYARVGIDEVNWELRTVAQMPPAPRIVISNKSTLPWLMEKIPSILISRARGMADRLAAQLAERTFPEILVTQSLRPTTVDGQHQLVPEDRLPDDYRLELIVEKRFGTKIDRISRLVNIGSEPVEKPRLGELR